MATAVCEPREKKRHQFCNAVSPGQVHFEGVPGLPGSVPVPPVFGGGSAVLTSSGFSGCFRSLRIRLPERRLHDEVAGFELDGRAKEDSFILGEGSLQLT